MKEITPEKGLSFEDMVDPAAIKESNIAEASALKETTGPNAEELQAMMFDMVSMQTVALMRIYDVLMCQYADGNSVDAKALMELHNAGKVRSTIPWMEQDTGESGVDN